MDKIGERIKESRLAMNLTRQELAASTGISPTALYTYETGERLPTLSAFKSLCEATKTLPAWLLTGNGLHRYEDLEYLITPIVEDLLTVCGITVANGLTEDERILLTHKFRVVLAARILELFDGNYAIVREAGGKQVRDNPENIISNNSANNGIISNGNNSYNTINKGDNYNFSGKVEGGINITAKTKRINTTIQPVQGTIGANPLLVERITGLFNELGLRREERYGKSAYSVMYKEFKKDFSIPRNQKYTSFQLWPEARAQEIIDYLEQKLSKTIQGKKEKASAESVQNTPYLLSESTRLHKMLGLTESDYRGRLHYLFGVTSRADLNPSQLANYVEYLRQEVEKI